jgi:FMN phosphatase YigB (HAD superfamily)
MSSALSDHPLLGAPSIDTLLLDFGHTLCDTASSPQFVVEWTAAHGSPIPADDALRLWEAARVASRSAEEVAKGRDRTPELHRSCWTALWAPLDALSPGIAEALYVHETGPDGWVPYVDTLAFLAGAKERGLKVAIISDVAFDLRPIAAAHGFGRYIDAFILSYEHDALKSDGPRLFNVALDALGSTAVRALMVGDNYVNDGLGISAGVRTLLLPHAATGTPRGLGAILGLVDGLR